MITWRELTFPTNALKETVIVIEDDRANILADPLRWLILETLGDGKSVSEFSRRLLALIEEYFPPGKGDQSGIKYGFYGILTPIDLQPLEDSETEE